MSAPAGEAAVARPARPPRTDTLAARYAAVRAQTERLCAPLEVEDYVARSFPDASPAKWHLAHTSWFFETFVLQPHAGRLGVAYRPLDPRYAFLFNSYYVQAGERHCRAQRGLVTRPTVRDVYAYRAHVDDAMRELLARVEGDDADLAGLRALVTLGLNHEQQHQELLATDLKHLFWMNPLRPPYQPPPAPEREPRGADDGPRWLAVEEGVHEIGHPAPGTAPDAFAFDNELPRHRVYLAPFRIATRLVTNREYLAFVADGGYRRPTLWLSAGWDAVQGGGWEAPLYWERDGDAWTTFTLHGPAPLDPDEPVCHLSRHEADAFARWSGARLPTEAEWEVAASRATAAGGGAPAGRFAESGRFHAGRADTAPDPQQWFGDLWQWTASPYVAYPGFRPAMGAVGEYNGKFMSDQWVMRGASIATPASHARLGYRNFFPADMRWQFVGLRLAQDAAGAAEADAGEG